MVDKWHGPPEDFIISPIPGTKESPQALKWIVSKEVYAKKITIFRW